MRNGLVLWPSGAEESKEAGREAVKKLKMLGGKANRGQREKEVATGGRPNEQKKTAAQSIVMGDNLRPKECSELKS